MNFLSLLFTKTVVKTTLFTLLIFASSVMMANAQSSHFSVQNEDMDAEFPPRLTPDEAIIAITTREGSVELLLTGEGVAIQFSDLFLQDIQEEAADRASDDDSHLASVLKSMIKSGVKTLLDRALMIPHYEINSIYYENGRLIIESVEGNNLFADLDINDVNIMEDFSRRDARRFVAEAERMYP